MIEQGRIFLDGAWVAPLEVIGSNDLVDPATESVFGESVHVGPADVDRAVVAADRALSSGPWSTSSLEERIEVVRRLSAGIETNRARLAGYQTRSMGAVYRTALRLGSTLELIEMYIAAVRELDFEKLRSDAYGTTLVTRRPVGVVAAILPWNAPLRSAIKKVIPALLAGCTVVVKPDPATPLETGLLAELGTAAGVPAGVLNVVTGSVETGRALVSHPLVRKIAFTGSTAAGADIARSAAPAFTRLQLELGGKSAAIVLEDADLDTTIRGIAAGNWLNAGQACTALTRVLVPVRRRIELTDAIVASAESQVVGDPMGAATTMGPLASKRQFERVMQYFDRARDEGTGIATGGAPATEPGAGFFVRPTVFSDVEADMTVAREEIFGPAISVIAYSDVAHALAIANSSPYGLHGAVFARDDAEAMAVARRMDTGSVGINRFGIPISAPFGGVKASGIGREHAVEGYESFLEYKSYPLNAGQ